MNRAVSAIYEPGSTFKLITLAAAFDQGITHPDEIFDCENGAVYISGHRIRDHKPFGLLTVSDILAKSSDVGAIKIALRLGGPKFYDYIRAFGFGTTTGVELPYESRGRVARLEDWKPISVGSISMGQEIGITPLFSSSARYLRLLMAACFMSKHVRLSPNCAVGKKSFPPMDRSWASSEPKRVIRPETAATLRRLMEGVVLHGTGPLAHLDGWTSGRENGYGAKNRSGHRTIFANAIYRFLHGFCAHQQSGCDPFLCRWTLPSGCTKAETWLRQFLKRIAEQVLAYLDVPRDVPLNPKLIQTAYRKQATEDPSALEDFSSVYFSGQPDPPPAASQTAGANGPGRGDSKKPVLTVAADQGGDIEVPDFSGKHHA